MALNIFLGIVDFILLFPLIYFLSKHKCSQYNISRTFAILNSLGCTNSVSGPIRSGKTSMDVGVIHDYEIIMQSKLQQEIDMIVSRLYYLDFNCINEYIFMKLDQGLDVDEIHQKLIEEYQIKNGIYNDFISCNEIYKYLWIYIDDLRILYFRNQFVFSKNYIYSYVTRKKSKYLYDETMQIKQVEYTNWYYLERYSIIFEDELSLDKSNKLSNSMAEYEKGRKEFKILFGQIFEETSRYLTIKQVAVDEIAAERRIIQNNLHICGRRFTNKMSLFVSILSTVKSFRLFKANIWFEIKKAFKVKNINPNWTFEDYKLSNTCLRYRIHIIDSMTDFIKAQQNISTLIHDYSKAEDVGKVDPKYFEAYTLTFPMKYCYGCYKTHEFSFVQKRLKEMSKVNFDDVIDTSFFPSRDLEDKIGSFLYHEGPEEIERRKDECGYENFYRYDAEDF